MSVSSDYYKQIGERTEFFNGYSRTTTTYIGDITSLSTLAKDNPKGHKYAEGGISSVVDSSVLETMQVDNAKWTLVYSSNPNQGGGSDNPLDEQWSMSMTQYEFPLEKYLNENEAGQLERWKETDIEHKKQWKYLNAMSETGPYYEDLTGKALDVAKKIWAGIESVLKFYPQATLVGVYDSKRTFSARALKLNKIDTKPDDEFDDFDVEWLKSAFDWTQNSNGTWTLTESWIGSPSWDKDLYGDNAWNFYDPTVGN